jgi:hypothetical protein
MFHWQYDAPQQSERFASGALLYVFAFAVFVNASQSVLQLAGSTSTHSSEVELRYTSAATHGMLVYNDRLFNPAMENLSALS